MNGLLNNIIRATGLIFLAIIIGCNKKNNVETGLRPVSTLYVNRISGDNRNPGTIRKPIKTISEVNRRLQIKPSCVSFAGGQVFDGTLFLNGIQGSDSFAVKIESYGNDQAVVNGGNNEAIRIENCRFVSVGNLYLTGSGRKDGNTTNGLQLVNSENCIIIDVISEGFQKSGVDLYNCRNIRVLKVLALYNGFCGINVMGSDKNLSGNILIRDCRAENNPGDPTMLDNHSGNGILVGVSDSVTIDHCTATGNGWDMPREGNGPVGIWTWQSDHITIQYCISYRNKTSKGGKDGGGFDLDGGVTNSLIQYCLSYENQGAGYGLFQYRGASDWSNNVIRYCVSINDGHTTEGSGSFFIWNGSNESRQLRDCYIYNNVAYNTAAPVVSFENASEHQNFFFSNNIFLGTGQMISGDNKGSSFSGNVWWGSEPGIRFMNYRSLSEWSRATGQEKTNGRITGLQADPGLTGPFLTKITDPYRLGDLTGYKLKPDSPLRNRGVETGLRHVSTPGLRHVSTPLPGIDLPAGDFFGNPVPLGESPEPGIHEML